MPLRHFFDYSCRIALEPEEWPGDWVQVLSKFPGINRLRMQIRDHSGSTTIVPISPADYQQSYHPLLYEELLSFFDELRINQIVGPFGGLNFVDSSGQSFGTNWDLRECSCWLEILKRLHLEQRFEYTFFPTEAVLEFSKTPEGVRLQHLDSEISRDIVPAQDVLQGVILPNLNTFNLAVSHALGFLSDFAEIAHRLSQEAAFEYAFGPIKDLRGFKCGF